MRGNPPLIERQMENFLPILGFIWVLMLVYMLWVFRRRASLIEQWADKNGYRIVSRKYRWLRKGPFFWTSSRGQTVYYVTMEDVQGNQRHGWVRCGSWFFGLLSDYVEVSWED